MNLSYQRAKSVRPAFILECIWGQLTNKERGEVYERLNFTDEWDVYHSHPRWYWTDRIFKNLETDANWRSISLDWVDCIWLAFSQKIKKKDIRDWITDRDRLFKEKKKLRAN